MAGPGDAVSKGKVTPVGGRRGRTRLLTLAAVQLSPLYF